MNVFKLLAILAFIWLGSAVFVPHASAQTNTVDTTQALNNPTTTSGLTSGLNEVLKWVFLFLKFLAIIACAYGSYEMWKGEFSKGIWSYVAALALFFAPSLVDLAHSIGQQASSVTASGGS